MTDTPTLTEERKRPPRTYTITVNENTEVTLTEHNLTGAEIKAAAIEAGAPIQPDFVLSKVRNLSIAGCRGSMRIGWLVC